MTQYVAAREELMGQADGRWSLPRLIHNWQARRQVRNLSDFEDMTLNDIGVTRDEVAWASRLPLSVNASVVLKDRAARRRLRESAR